MKDIIAVFLKGITAGAVTVALLLIFANIKINVNGSTRTGVLDILGAASDKAGIQYDSLTDTEIAGNVISEHKPVVKYTSPDIIIRNKPVNLLSCFSITEYNGNGTDYVTDNASDLYPDKVYIKSILKEDRTTSVADLYDEATGNMTFTDSGVYFVTIVLRDNENRENIMTVKVPVRLEEV